VQEFLASEHGPEAMRFNDASSPLCIIDNTSVLVVGGAGPGAVIAPEMVAFARTLGFVFCAHHLGHADRKGRTKRADYGYRRALRHNQIYRNLGKLSCQLRHAVNGFVAITKDDNEVTNLDEAKVSPAPAKSIHVGRQACGLLSSNPADARHLLRLLCARHSGPRNNAIERSYELPPPHLPADQVSSNRISVL
jgi:hypothetical protein